MTCQLPLSYSVHRDGHQFFLGKSVDQFNCNYTFQARDLVALPRARLIDSSWAIVSYDNYLFSDSYFNKQLLQKSGSFLENNLKLNIDGQLQEIPFALYKNDLARNVVNTACYLPLYAWHHNYHHWLIECLPMILEYINAPFFNNCKIIMPSQPNLFQKATLEILDIPEDKIVYFDEQDSQFTLLYSPSLGNFSPRQLQAIRHQFFTKLGITGPRPERLLYVSRKDARERQISNESEIQDYLISRGFEILHLTGKPLAEQIRLFSQAKVIIGPHGAGLSNAIFAPKECTLVELLPDDNVNMCFWLLANSLGLAFTYLVGQVNGSERRFGIEMPMLKQLVEEIV